jgi:hypothetical protein
MSEEEDKVDLAECITGKCCKAGLHDHLQKDVRYDMRSAALSWRTEHVRLGKPELRKPPTTSTTSPHPGTATNCIPLSLIARRRHQLYLCPATDTHTPTNTHNGPQSPLLERPR